MKRIALLFPGQGSQYVGMGKSLYENYDIVKEVFEEASQVLNYDMKKMCFDSTIEELTMTENTQPALLTVSMAAYKVLCEELQAEPLFGAGHSLGEISALTCAGAIDFADALKLVKMRGKFMQEASSDGATKMVSIIGSTAEEIGEWCKRESTEKEIAVISNYNSPMQTVISGHAAAVDRVTEFFQLKGVKTKELNVSAPFHSPLMESAADRFHEELKKYTYHDLRWPVISNYSALPYQGKESILSNLTVQIVSPVQWTNTMEYLESMGIDTVIEVGSKRVLTSLTQKSTKELKAYPTDKIDQIKQIIEANKEKNGDENSDAKRLKNVIARCMGIAVCIRNQNFDEAEYNAGVIEPYRKIKAMYETLEGEGMNPTVEQALQAIEMLKSVFVTKKLPVEQQIMRFQQLFRETKSLYLFPEFKMPEC